MSENFEPNDNDAAFRDFVKRLLTYREVAESETNEELQLILGKLPEDLRVKVPILENSKIIGSKVEPNKLITIIFESDRTEKEVIDFYRQELLGEGWQQDDTFGRGGFSDPNLSKTFYLTLRGPGISISTYKISDRVTEVWLYVQPKSRHPQYGIYRHQYRSEKLIPDLVAPPNSSQQFKSSGGDHEDYNSRATLKTDLDLSAVADSYIRQLQEFWQLSDRAENGPIAWSSWNFEDRDRDRETRTWRGLLFVYQNIAVPREYFLQVQISLVS